MKRPAGGRPIGWGLSILLLCLAFTEISRGEIPIGKPTIVLVVGISGEETYATQFAIQTQLWESMAKSNALVFLSVGTSTNSNDQDLDRLKSILEREPTNGVAPLWLVLIGHGTFDGQMARFNLRGPDLTATQLASWLTPFHRPLAIIDTSAASAPFLNALSFTNRVVITATRSGNEQNYARLGQYLAEALARPESDLDQDGQVSLLELFLAASARVKEFYQSENRLATEHPLIDDNGDGKGTPAEWFRGTRVVRASKEGAMTDGDLASRFFLRIDPLEEAWSDETREKRDRLELELKNLREQKGRLTETEYLHKLESILFKLAGLYETSEKFTPGK